MTIQKRLEQLKQTGKIAKETAKISAAVALTAAIVRIYDQTHISTPEKERARTEENIEKVRKEIEEILPEPVETNKVMEAVYDGVEKIALRGTYDGGKIREAIAKWKAERKTAREE